MGSKRTGKVEQGGERVEKVVLRSSVLTGAAEGMIRFLLGAVLAGGEIFGVGAPFGVAMTACLVGLSLFPLAGGGAAVCRRLRAGLFGGLRLLRCEGV